MPTTGTVMAWPDFAAKVKELVIRAFGRLDAVVDLNMVQAKLRENNIDANMPEVCKAFNEAMRDPAFRAHFTLEYVPARQDRENRNRDTASTFKLKWVE